jgi:hypothetical protein
VYDFCEDTFPNGVQVVSNIFLWSLIASGARVTINFSIILLLMAQTNSLLKYGPLKSAVNWNPNNYRL